MMITIYTIVDSLGVRASDPFKYIVYYFIIDGFAFNFASHFFLKDKAFNFVYLKKNFNLKRNMTINTIEDYSRKIKCLVYNTDDLVEEYDDIFDIVNDVDQLNINNEINDDNHYGFDDDYSSDDNESDIEL